jgi:hypothetical protein
MDTGGWHRVDPVDVPDEGRVRSVTVDGRTVALARCGARLGALENRTVDVGNHAYSLGRYLESKGQPVLMSGYLGSIGFGYPAALGAWAAAPGPPVRRRRPRPAAYRAGSRASVEPASRKRARPCPPS